MRRFLIPAMLLLLSSCGWFGASEEQRLFETGSSAPSEIPPELDQPNFVDAMPIPEIQDYRGLAGQEFEVGLPQPLSTSFGVEQIVIRRLGEDRWVFLDLPTATIWPQIVLFWEDNHLPVAELDPRNGMLETDWLVGASGNPDEIFESFKDGSAWRDREGARQYKFRVRLEPGVRSGSSELYVEQIERPLGADIEAEWVGKSVNPELEGKMLSAMAYYLGDRMAQGPTVSLLAAGLQESKAVLETGPDGMVLKYRLQFDRAWATVGAALEDARVDVKDLDRTAANYYVHYTAQHDPDPGFLRRVFSRDDGDQDPGHAFVVNLQPEGEDVLVTVAMEQETGLGTTESLILRERLLKLIKEYST